jgi:ELWxxDGT repeat protein/VCBS repeat-containing protein
MPGTNEVLTTTVGPDGKWSVTPTQALPEGGPQTVAITETDAAGNSSTANVPVTIDTAPPPVTAKLDPSSDSGTVGDGLTNDNTPTISGSGEPGNTIKVTMPGTGEVLTTTVKPDGSWSVTPTQPLPEGGPQTVAVTAIDPAGNSSSSTVPVTIDTIPPVPTITLSPNVTADDIINKAESTQQIPVTGTVGGDAKVGDTVTLTVNNKTFTGTVQADKSFSINVPGADLVADADKTIDAKVTTTDAAGNAGSATASDSYTVNLNTAPVAVADTAAVVESGGNVGDSAYFAGTASAVGNLLANDTDADAGDSKAMVSVNGSTVNASGDTVVAGTYGTLTIKADGSYSYALDNSKAAVNALAAGSSAIETFNYVMKDGAGATATSKLDVTVTGTNDAPVLNNTTISNVAGLMASQTYTGIAITSPSDINGNAAPLSVPSGWVPISTPDLNDYNNTAWNGTYAGFTVYNMSNLNGTSLNGGQYVDMCSWTVGGSEGMSTTLTGLTAGQTYVYGAQWQQMTFAGANNYAYNSGGQLVMSINGTDKIFTSSGVSDGWQTALYQFTATGTTATISLRINGINGVEAAPAAYAGKNNGGAIAVDSLSITQIQQLNVSAATGVKASVLIGGVVDADQGASIKGYAITSATASASGNHWQYSADNGTTWVNMDAASTAAAIFISADYLLRWTGMAGSNTKLAAVAVDNTSIASFDTTTVGHLDVGLRGGNTPYSANVATLAGIDVSIILNPNITSDDTINIAEQSQNIPVSGVVGSDVKAGDTVTLTVNNKTFTGTVQADKTFSINVPGSDLVADADKIIDAKVVSAAGTATTSEAYRVDITPPVLTAKLDPSSDSGTVGDGITNDTTPTISGTGEPGASIKVTMPGTGEVLTTKVQPDGTWSVTPTQALANGSTGTAQVQATDAAGNSSMATVALTIDNVAPPAPVVTITTDTNNDGLISGSEIGVATTLAVRIALPTEAKAGDTLQINLGTSTQTVILTAANITAGAVTTTVAKPAEQATATVSAKLTDVAGNVSPVSSDSAKMNASAPELTGKAYDPNNGPVLFQAKDDSGGYNTQPWITDLTESGTKMLKQIGSVGNMAVNAGHTAGANFFDMGNGKALFQADDGTTGLELWVTDGTDTGTKLLKDLMSDSSTPTINGMARLGNGKVVFAPNGGELWVTDGTVAGTVQLKDLNPGSTTPSFYGNSVTSAEADYRAPTIGADFTNIGNGKVIFQAKTDANGVELWITDGTAAGTGLLKDIAPGVASSNAGAFTNLGNGKTLFYADDGTNGNELWVTDCTAAGTKMVKDIFPGDSSNPYSFTSMGNGKALFMATTAQYGRELWITDGTAAGTNIVKDITVGIASSQQVALYDMNDLMAIGNGKYLFSASQSASNAAAVWVTDGTAAGTQLLADLGPGKSESGTLSVGFRPSSPYLFTALGNGYALFAGETTTYGKELWLTDGSKTWMVADINNLNWGVTYGSSMIADIVSLGSGKAIFTAYDDTHGSEPRVFDFNTWSTLNAAGQSTEGAVSLLKDIRTDRADNNSQAQGYVQLGTAHEDVPYVINKSYLLQGWTSPTGGTLNAANVTADHGTVSQQADGSYLITPEAHYNGALKLSYDVVSSSGASTPASMNFTLAPETDIFRYTLADVGTSKTLTNFDTAPRQQGGDVLDFRDLLQGENSGSLAQYLHFSHDSTGTNIAVSSKGNGVTDFNLKLSGIDIIGGFTSDQQVIQDLLTKNKLITD